ncbi:MAG: MMPL family transporter [Spirochaetales bacterium]|nr:MMPL family transporter [Spirochaetales bacterium]
MNFIINNRGLVFIVTIAITLFFGFFIATNFEMDSSITAVLPKDDPDFVYNTEIGNVFGSSEDVYISVAANDSVYSTQGLTLIRDIHQMLFDIETETKEKFLVTESITSIKSIADQATALNPNEKINFEGEISDETVEHVKALIENNPIAKGKIVSEPKYFDEENNTIDVLAEINSRFDDYKRDYLIAYDAEYQAYEEAEDKSELSRPIRKSDLKIQEELLSMVMEDLGLVEQHKMTIITVPTVGDVGFNDKKLDALVQKNLKPRIKELNEEYPDFTIELTGQPVVKSDITKYMLSDLMILFPVSIFVVLLIILFMLKSFRGTLIPIIITVISVAWTFGFKFMLGSPVTMTESVIPVVLISVACADGIHITNQALYFIDRGVPGKAAVYDAMSLVSLPVILASITTAVGFGSLITAPGVSLKNMGIYLAFGVLTAMVLSLVLIPAMISFFKTPSPRRIASSAKQQGRFRFTQKLRPITSGILKFKWGMLVITIGLIAVSIPGVMNISSDTNEITYFKKSADVRVATENIEKNLGGINTLYIVIENTDLIEKLKENNISYIPYVSPPKSLRELETIEANGVLTPEEVMELERLRSIEALQQQARGSDSQTFNRLVLNAENYRLINELEESLEQHKRVSSILSYTSYIKLMNFYFSNSKTFDQFVLPQSSRYINSIQNQLKNGEMKGLNINEFIAADGTRMCMKVRINDSNSTSIQEVKDILSFKADESSKSWEERFEANNLKIRYAGDNVRIRNGEIIVESQIKSLISSIVLIILLLIIMFRSVFAGLIVSVPVIIAIFLNFTIMWIAGISLNPATSIIASVGMGVGIDYSIHFFSRFKNVYQFNNNYREALIEAAVQSSSGIISNAIAVGTGFLVLMFSSYTIIQQMGWIIALSMFTSALGALTILPALLYIFQPKIKTHKKVYG